MDCPSIRATCNQTNRRIAVSPVNLGLVNARSMRNKTDLLIDHVIGADIDLLSIRETWISPGESDAKTIKDATPDGYTFAHVPTVGNPVSTAKLVVHEVASRSEDEEP